MSPTPRSQSIARGSMVVLHTVSPPSPWAHLHRPPLSKPQPMPIRATTGPTNKIAGRSLSSHGGALIYTHLQAGMRSMWNRSGGLTQLASRLRNPASPAEPGVRSSPHYMRDGSGC
eukprot:CAMPEP_0181172188 /NCGR_PEP_ID=MMETSP1096-20121128/2318_1 /TAXON_ID=156174 ORGANISM="Chrysochromulina ericina, Strain CCMP281" /NCGR_SAMPLE_ID=MMETSP1096 /ASSEMBLY_ACC=CAM_ASM_000453 /LENGTH=115 /DNA_ID=CAMNT_0023259903 /DNA_START=222 /DNA_END=569 /DNA_ORIENTATION=-